MHIQWSDEDHAFIVSLPEFGPFCHTHGSTYGEAARKGRECLESLIEAYAAEGWALPKPRKYRGSEPKKKRVTRKVGQKASA
jgi:predicted RNase H-like HicB family nuclease